MQIDSESDNGIAVCTPTATHTNETALSIDVYLLFLIYGNANWTFVCWKNMAQLSTRHLL